MDAIEEIQDCIKAAEAYWLRCDEQNSIVASNIATAKCLLLIVEMMPAPPPTEGGELPEKEE